MHTALRQTADAEDLALMKFKIEAEQVIHRRQVFCFQDYFITVSVHIGAVIVTFYFTADHHLFDQVRIIFIFFQ